MKDLELLDDHQLAVQLARYGGLPAELLDRPEWLALLMPTVRDDLRIVQSFQPSKEPPLPCPLHIFGGFDDPLAPPDALAAWSALTAQPHAVRLYSGGHFLFRSPEPGLVTAIAQVAADAARQGSELH
jgi:surfactin synthase thioesterase subunit